MLALSPAELQLCQQQKRTYTRIYNALKRSNIPFTSTQWEMLGSIRAHMKETTGHPSSRADISMMNDLTSLLDLLSREDHLSSKESGSMVINSTMEKQVELMIEELSDLVWEESRRVRPFRATHESPLDIATFVTIHLREIQQRKSNSRTKFIFYSGCKEILHQLTLVFSESNFPFNNHQHRQIENLCTSIRRFNGDPKTENFEGIKLQFLAFVCSLQQNTPPREIVKTNTATMTDPSGPVTKAVDYITFGLHGLARTTSEHLQNYKAESRDSPLELITIIINQFMRIYPPRYTFPQPRAHNINGNPMDASISI